jgi:hypothetical protein
MKLRWHIEKREAVMAIEAAVLPLMQCGIHGNGLF